jgi:hypothetical protein
MTKQAGQQDDDFIHDPEGEERQEGLLAWQERAYFTLHGPDGTGLDIGCGRHPDAGEQGAYSAYGCLSTPEQQTNIRAAGPLASKLGVPNAEPFTFEMVEPHTRWDIRLEDNDVLQANLTFQARSAMWALPQARITGKDGTVASTQVLFQSGVYNGTIETGDRTIEVVDWAGARDRTWGFRRYEGRLPSGLMIAAIFEFDDHCLILWTIERKTGERVMGSGARLRDDGSITPVDSWQFDLSLEGEIGQLNGARLELHADGEDEEYTISPALSTVYLAGGGYLEKGRHGQAAEETQIWTDTWKSADPAVRRSISGLDDHVVEISGSREGSGILELQLGRHEKYLPEGWPSLTEGLDELGQTRRL